MSSIQLPTNTLHPPKVIIISADAGQDPTEVAVPWKKFRDSGWEVTFATENGNVARADERLLANGFFATFLGASKEVGAVYREMTDSEAHKNPLAWSKPEFSLVPYDAVLLPGGHDKPIRQYLDSESLHLLLREYWPLVKRSRDAIMGNEPSRVVGAICHGVVALSNATYPLAPGSRDAKGPSLLHDVETSTLPYWMEQAAWVASQAWLLGGYYKTYGARRSCASDVSKVLDKKEQYKCGPLSQSPFVHVDPNYHYISARFPGDAWLFAEKMIEEVHQCRNNTIDRF
ncbi:class I glutamine amidotransferase-like protein [Tuber borchii]|uniref:Class I glutamine amidotransferase-like protein n=1 Tax=Tuber borchii TaxID=42251 RepID=A0A2T7A8Z3_TUBBO|nr:class I glutamine amidotransferase-like protein [Tuber borchii]